MPISKIYLLSVFIISSFSVQAQTSGEIFENYLNAIGGKDKIDSVETAIIKSKMSSFFSNLTCVTSLKRDYKHKIELFYADGRNSVYCFNGSVYTGSNKKAISMMTEIDRKTDKFPAFNSIVFIPKSELQKEPAGEINNRKCYVLSRHDAERGSSHKYYFDVDTFLLLAVDYDLSSKSFSTRTLYENYQPIDGILFPMRNVEVTDIGENTTEYTEIILNPELPDDIFECNPE